MCNRTMTRMCGLLSGASPTTQAGVYGQCLSKKLTELEKGVCEKEFVHFNTCMQHAIVRPLPLCSLPPPPTRTTVPLPFKVH
jgi:hypothetical protein